MKEKLKLLANKQRELVLRTRGYGLQSTVYGLRERRLTAYGLWTTVYGKGKLTADGLWTTVERLVEDCGLMDYGLRTTVYGLRTTEEKAYS